MKNFNTLLSLVVCGVILFTSCIKKKKDPVTEEPSNPDPVTYTVPSTYDFGTNTDFTSSSQRIAMAKELINYIRTTHTSTAYVTIDAAKMKNMFSNLNSPFADATLNASGVSVKQKTNNSLGVANQLESMFDEVAAVSQTTVEGSNGIAGKVYGPLPTTTTSVRAAYLMNAKGFEYKELAEKGLMGAMHYAEATTLLKNIGTYDNSTTVAGQGTAMEHAWDEAFGYFGVPVSFPSSTIGLSHWGSYCNSVNPAIGSNATIMNAWLKGRAAISNKDYAGRDAARDIVVATWEKIGAARCITYLKQAKTNFANDGARNHALSEGVGFIVDFRYNPSKTISDVDIALLLNYLGDNLYTVSQTNIDNAINKLATIFSLDASKL
jgi:hypothetical protein